MSELVPCTSGVCNNGQVTIPTMALDTNGNPIVIQDVITCIVCKGNGMVER